VIVKAPGLLPMLYTVRELAHDLDIPERTLRDWLKAGAPHQKDHRNHTWINGNDFARWVRSQQKTKKPTLPSNQAYCFHCKTVVTLNNPVQHHIKGKLIHIVGQCETCGCTINRGGRLGKTD
jgi:hypothetical protein